MGRRTPTLLGIAALAAPLLLPACSDGDGGGVVADDVAATTTAAPPSTAAPTTTSTPAPPQTPLPTGREAIDALLAAWEAGDLAAAALVADADAVAALFAVPVEPRDDRGCNGTSVQVNVQCVFRLPSGELQVRAAPTLDGTGYLVDFVLLGS